LLNGGSNLQSRLGIIKLVADEPVYQRLDKFRLPPGFRGRAALYVQLWWLFQALIVKHLPQICYPLRRGLLRAFGARIGSNVLIRQGVEITFPWKVTIGDNTWIGDDVTLYSLGPIVIGANTVISQKSYICAADHDYTRSSFPIRERPVQIGDQVWIGADVWVGPGVKVADGAVVGARSTVIKDLPEAMVYVGSPCKPVRRRKSADDPSKTLIFVSSHRSAIRVADRMIGALAAQRKIKLFSFDRKIVDHPVYSDPNVSHTSLGRMKDGIALSRLYSLLRATWILSRAMRRNEDTETVVLVNSLELLIVSSICGLTRLPTVYDVSDIHPMQLSQSALGRCLRWIERKMLMRVRLLVVTSPWYYWEYYERWLGVQSPALLIENKVGSEYVNKGWRPALSNRIAWNGLLRCQASARVLLQCMATAPDSVHLSLHGTLDRLGPLGRELAQQPNCVFTGLYRPEALSALLKNSSFVWAIDFSEGENSKWLLPYRLYSAIAAGLPVIAVDGTATADVVRHHNLGIVLSEFTAQKVIEAIEHCDPRSYETWAQNVRNLQDRAARGDEWAMALEDVGRWDRLRLLPTAVDVNLVLSHDPIVEPDIAAG
jgi:putative colanic acid biosynthesis acetyltransferase WcaF